jgi:hypothetical protein
MSSLLTALKEVFPEAVCKPHVVFEKRLLKICDLAAGFTQSERTIDEIADRARKFGIDAAAAMIGLEADVPSVEEPPRGLVYLGMFDTREAFAHTRHEDALDHNALYQAAMSGDAESVSLILESSPASVYEKNEAGHSPLMAGATKENPEIVRLLLAAGARVDEVSPENEYSPLHWALHHPPEDQERVLKVVELLVEHGADTNAIGHNGVTPLMLAAWFGAERAVAFLLRNGATPAARDVKGRTATEMAEQRGHNRIKRMLG